MCVEYEVASNHEEVGPVARSVIKAVAVVVVDDILVVRHYG